MQLEQDYLATRNTLQHCSRYVLLSVLTTLLDEYPMQLTVPIRMRLEQALMQRQGMVTSPNNNASNCSSNRKAPAFQANPAADGAAASWGNAPNGQTSNPISPYNNQSPNHRKPRHKNKEEDQELCSVHQSMRALKHLQKNPQTGLYECVHGFHCLVEGGSSPSKPAHQSYNNSASNHVAAFNSGPPDQLKGFSAVHVDSNADADRYDEGQDLKELQDLLQSVRDMDEDE
ncbi:hypothetical protein AGDE_15085 [Angomonas deanei]|uniref:Uncharacterized protein n=1 Tax=Angomonas deanei TaxID=59799 RepID=A0A7G2CP12_9TRYP|nr:hypothetical protein AGDE_15085 [Angomonas deanei]CAD2221099.1 hypothetical protein, conserved [Angomonas deanei]|eukprot:EPY19709.1 hypothetical protein AGDE_15085 [Angomonas deanei]